MRDVLLLKASRKSRERGGLLITALMLTAIMGIALSSYLSLGRSAIRLSNRNFYVNAAVDLAETGVEQGMWAVNAAASNDTAAWTGWTTDSTTARRTFSGFSYSGGVTGYVKVHVSNYAGSGAVVTAKSTVVLQDNQVIEKWIQVTLKGRSLFAYALLARNKITAAGGCEFDSWESDPDGNPATAAIPWSSSVANSNATIAAGSTAASAVTLSPSAIVYGKVAVGTASGAAIVYGAQTGAGKNSAAGLYQDWGTKVGVKGSMPSSSNPYLATESLTTGFSASFEETAAPGGATVRAAYVLPRGVSGPPYYLSAESLGTTGAATILQLDKLTVEGAATLTIKGDVTLILPPSGVQTINITASGKVVLESGATLTIYTPGNINVSGAGIANPSAPEALQIWSTRASGSLGQTIALAGSGSLSGVIYAPDATLSIPGGTNFFGAAVVYSATLTGSGKFHFDESLKNFSSSGGEGGSVEIESYLELNTTAQRNPYESLMNF